MTRLIAMLLMVPIMLVAPNAHAQNWGEGARDQAAPVIAFVRFSPQPRASKSTAAWQYGLSFAAPSEWSPALSGAGTLGRDHTTSGVEIRLGEADRGLWSRGSNGQKLASFNMAVDRLDANEGAGSKKTSIGTILLIGGVVVGGLILISAASSDNPPLLCTGNTIPNPIKGTCEPI
jgi:hypothetical protein